MRNLCKSKTNEQINVYLMLWRRGFLLNLCPVFLDKLGCLFPAKSDHFGWCWSSYPLSCQVRDWVSTFMSRKTYEDFDFNGMCTIKMRNVNSLWRLEITLTKSCFKGVTEPCAVQDTSWLRVVVTGWREWLRYGWTRRRAATEMTTDSRKIWFAQEDCGIACLAASLKQKTPIDSWLWWKCEKGEREKCEWWAAHRSFSLQHLP